MFTEPQPTQFDLNFRLFGTRVRVHPFFWLVTLIMGFNALREEYGFILLLVWVVCVFLSILVHEFGHILMGRYFGSHGHIVLYGFGGLAIPDRHLPNRWHRILVSLAGPGAQFVLLAVTIAVSIAVAFAPSGGTTVSLPVTQQLTESNPDDRPKELTKPADEEPAVTKKKPLSLRRGWGNDNLGSIVLGEIFWDLFWINSFWAIINLFPLWPLDGGRVCRELCEWFRPGRRGIRTSLYISIGAAVAGAVFMVWLGQFYTILFFGLFGYIAVRELQFLGGGGGSGPGWGQPPRRPWEADPDWWKTGRRDPWS